MGVYNLLDRALYLYHFIKPAPTLSNAYLNVYLYLFNASVKITNWNAVSCGCLVHINLRLYYTRQLHIDCIEQYLGMYDFVSSSRYGIIGNHWKTGCTKVFVSLFPSNCTVTTFTKYQMTCIVNKWSLQRDILSPHCMLSRTQRIIY